MMTVVMDTFRRAVPNILLGRDTLFSAAASVVLVRAGVGLGLGCIGGAPARLRHPLPV